MDVIGLILVFGGMVALTFTGIRFARRQAALSTEMKTNYQETWVSHGKPGISLLDPFASLFLNELIFRKQPDLGGSNVLMQLHADARGSFFLFGANFGLVFVGLFLLGAS